MRSRSVERFRRRPAETQRKELERLLRECARTEFGRRYGFGEIRTPEAFAQRVERFDYTSFKPYVERMMAGEADVAAPGRVRWFARSSGTTSERSKYLPVTDVSLWRCHTRGLRDVATLYVGQYPSTRVFEGKTLTLGGTCSKSGGIVVGDLSALLVERTPFWSGWFRTPRRETALLDDFDEKVERICRECASERVTAFAGVPSWNLALLRRMVEYTGRRNLCEVWPHLELFAHGGVGFEPYRAAFRELIPSAEMHYMETYNASEGFFAIADDASRDDMLLMLDYGTYYEFRDGGEVVPSFFVGATFGCVFGGLLGLPPAFAAAVGLVAVFCGAVNCPIASVILSVELFGAGGMAYFAAACAISYLLSGYCGLYSSQTILYSKLKAEFINVHTHE